MNQTKNRQVISLLLGVLMLLGMAAFAGCSQQETESKTSSAMPQSSSQEEKVSSSGEDSSAGSSVSAKTITLIRVKTPSPSPQRLRTCGKPWSRRSWPRGKRAASVCL